MLKPLFYHSLHSKLETETMRKGGFWIDRLCISGAVDTPNGNYCVFNVIGTECFLLTSVWVARRQSSFLLGVSLIRVRSLKSGFFAPGGTLLVPSQPKNHRSVLIFGSFQLHRKIITPRIYSFCFLACFIPHSAFEKSALLFLSIVFSCRESCCL